MRLEIDKSRIWWISDNNEMYACGSEMELAGINGISLTNRYIIDGNCINTPIVMFFFPHDSLYCRLQKIIKHKSK
jgi:hypothetical protein